jgi:hypothetical protein
VDSSPARGGGGSARSAETEGACHVAPSTMLRMVPLPRFAGEEKTYSAIEAAISVSSKPMSTSARRLT